MHTHRPNDVQWELLSILLHCRLSKQRKRNEFVESISDRLVVGVDDHGHQIKPVVAVVVIVVVLIDPSLNESNNRFN